MNLRERAETVLQHDRITAQHTSVAVSEIRPGTSMYEILTAGGGVAAGVAVNARTAMCVSAVFASIGLIGGAIAALPFHFYKRGQAGRERYDSDIWYLFNESPSPAWTAAAAWMHVAQSVCLRGDAFWRIHTASPYSSKLDRLEPLHPDKVFVQREKQRNVYTYIDDDNVLQTVDQDDMLHFPGIGFDGRRSITPIKAALRNPVGIALAADQFASSFFSNGARPDYVLKHPGSKIDDKEIQRFRQMWLERYSGVGNAHLPAMLTGGMELQQLTLNSEDAQLLDTRKYQVEDIARIFGVPPHMIGHTEKATSWGTGVEQMSMGFVRFTLRRWLDSIQQEVNRKLYPKSGLYYAEFNADALLDGDTKTQGEFFAKALGGPGSQGWMTVNEVRRLKNLPPVPDGGDLIYAGSAPATNSGTQKDDT